jgi:hypothetical protein
VTDVGNDAGWALTFHHEEPTGTVVDTPAATLTRDHYDGEIAATLAGDLSGGTFSIAVEGVTDADYARIAGGPAPPRIARLFLYWRDTLSAAGYLASVAGLTDLYDTLVGERLRGQQVAELAIVEVSRRTGRRQYEVVVTAQQRAFRRLATKRVDTALDDTPLAVVEKLVRDVGAVPVTYGFNRDGSIGSGAARRAKVSVDARTTHLEGLRQVAALVEQATNRHGRSLVVIRGDEVHVGPRPTPLSGADPTRLTAAEGLVEVARAGEVERDPTAPPGPTAKPPRTRFRLTLKGRPDVLPGDAVEFTAPPADVPVTLPSNPLQAVASAFVAQLGAGEEGAPVLMCVESVQHQLGPRAGFVTTVGGVSMDSASDIWDERAAPPSAAVPKTDGTGAGGPVDAAAAIRRVAEEVAASLRSTEIGQVRAITTVAGAADRSAHTERVWRGLEAPDGGNAQAARLPVRATAPSPVDPVPYASPFAWGKCGLVLPRYPGTRVVLAHRNGVAADPVDVGALWDLDAGPDAKPGDWWLILPVGVSSGARSSVADGTTPKAHAAEVTNDLIDAEGNRVIETGSLTISVGPKSLHKAGERPKAATNAVVTIANADKKAQIAIDADGTITITAAQNLVLDAANGDITLHAKKVDVKVGDAMDVHK